jgi:hypothetical protein
MAHRSPAPASNPRIEGSKRVRAEIARLVGESSVAKVARDLGLGREQVARIAAGLDVREGTLLVAKARLEAGGPPEAA